MTFLVFIMPLTFNDVITTYAPRYHIYQKPTNMLKNNIVVFI